MSGNFKANDNLKYFLEIQVEKSGEILTPRPMLSVMQLADIFCSAFVREKMGQILTNQEKYIEQTSQPRKTMDNIRDTKWVVESIM